MPTRSLRLVNVARMSRVDPPICCSCCKPFPQPHDAEDVHLKYTTAQLRPLYIRIYCWVCCLSQLDADLFHVFFCGRVMKKRWLLLHTQRQCYGTLLFPNEILGRDRLTKPMTPTRAAHILSCCEPVDLNGSVECSRPIRTAGHEFELRASTIDIHRRRPS